jgi:hypothetical protein
LCRNDPKRIGDNLKTVETEESCTTYNMLKVQKITRNSISPSCKKMEHLLSHGYYICLWFMVACVFLCQCDILVYFCWSIYVARQWFQVSRHLFRWTKEVTYADYYERALTNGVLSIQRGTDPGVMIYMLPLSIGVSKAKSYHKWGTPFDSFWCCYGTGKVFVLVFTCSF